MRIGCGEGTETTIARPEAAETHRNGGQVTGKETEEEGDGGYMSFHGIDQLQIIVERELLHELFGWFYSLISRSVCAMEFI